MKTKKCTTCKELKTYDSFYKDKTSPTGYGYECKICKRNYKPSPEVYARQLEKSRQHNRFKWSGFTEEDFQNKLKEQNYKCAICETDDPGKTNWHADHDHNTGTKRGILCKMCNTALGMLNDDIDRLANSIKYLNHYSDPADKDRQ
jgi:hypothetical protein